MQKVNIQEKLASFSDYWNPRIVGELNGQHVKATKLKGEFIWHHHDLEDEMFLVIKGKLKMEFREKTVEVNRRVYHCTPRGRAQARSRRGSGIAALRTRLHPQHRQRGK